jgi:hypothetical protein
MNKPLLPAHTPRRVSFREIALALVALGCAAGWLHERMENQASAEVEPFVKALAQLRQNPDIIVNASLVKGKFPVSCRMQRMETAPPPEAGTDLQLPADVTAPVVKPGDTSKQKKPAEAATPPTAPQPVTSPDKPVEPPPQPADPAAEKSP